MMTQLKMIFLRWAGAFYRSLLDVRKAEILEQGASVAFFSVLSLFPLVLVLLQLSFQFGALARSWDRAMQLVESVVPPEVAQTLMTYYQNSHDVSSVGLFSASFVSALWLSTFAFQAALKAVRNVLGMHRRPGPWSRSLSLVMMFYVYFSAILAVQLLAVGGWLLSYLAGFDLISAWSVSILWIVRWVLIGGFTFSASLLIMGMASNDYSRLRQHVAGALLFSVSWILVTRGMVAYYQLFDTHKILFGAISSLFVLMMWIYSMCVLLLFCARFNRHYHKLEGKIMAPRQFFLTDEPDLPVEDPLRLPPS